MTIPTPTLLTIGQLAAALGVPAHRVQYLLQSRGIHEHSRAGRYRLFAPEQVEAVRQALQPKGSK